MKRTRLPLRLIVLAALGGVALVRVGSSRVLDRASAFTGEASATTRAPSAETSAPAPEPDASERVLGARDLPLGARSPDFAARFPESSRDPAPAPPAPRASTASDVRRARLAACIRRLGHARGAGAIFDPASLAVARAAVALGRDGLVVLLDAVEDERGEPAARALACGLLEGLHARDGLALAALAGVTRPEEPPVLRRAATRALGSVAPDRFRGRFLELARDPDALVRLEALVGLARGGDVDAVARIEAAAVSEGPGYVRSASLAALYAIDNARSREALERCRAYVPPDARPIVSLLLAKQGERTKAIEADVRLAAEDPSRPERQALALAVLASWGR